MKIFKKIFKWLAIGIGLAALSFVILVVIRTVTKDPVSDYERQINHPKISSVVSDSKIEEPFKLNVIQDNREIKTISLESLRGKNVLLFWYSECPGAKAALPELGETSSKYKNDLEVFIIHQNDEAPVREIKAKYPELNICQGKTENEEHVFAYPGAYHTVLLDKNGKVVVYDSYIHSAEIAAYLECLIKNKELNPELKHSIDFHVARHNMRSSLPEEKEYLEYYEITDSLDISLDVFSTNNIMVSNKDLLKIYELATGIDKQKFIYKDMDTLSLSGNYFFCYGLDYSQLNDFEKFRDIRSFHPLFQDSVLSKLDRIAEVSSEILVENGDTVLLLSKAK